MYYAIKIGTSNVFKITFTPSEDSGQPGQIRSLIRVVQSGAFYFKNILALPK